MSKFKICVLLQFLLFLALPILAQVDTGWVRRYNGPGNLDDYATALMVDESGNVYVTGYSYGVGTSFDYATIKYAANGDSLWVRRYNGPGNYDDKASALAVDGSGNVYVTGYSVGSGSASDYATIEYAPNGDRLWVRRYNGPVNGDDRATALAVDGSGNVYVTGSSASSSGYFSNDDYATIKYAPVGDTLWVRRYNGPGYSNDEATALTVDGSGNVYVTGGSYGTYYDYTTIKYAPNGDNLAVSRYDGPGNYHDEATALVVDESGNVYVTGYSWNGTSYDYATIRYAPNGDTLAVRRFNGTGNGDDLATALAVDNNQNVYVTGRSYDGPDNGLDYCTIKYAHLGCVVKSGDANNDGKVNLTDIIFNLNYLFKDGTPPTNYCAGDYDADGAYTIFDLIYQVNYIFKGGPAPLKSKECCL